ncbi:MAG TPA: hypothetical protein P5121_13045 [Caldilineaceae bacterium]|nr:hypothetical protein [Caldilineaceae bacterium]HRW06023.1 hypothetical protein [Caldilineaceae bacterium]
MTKRGETTNAQRWINNYVVSFLCWLIAVALTVLDILYGRILVMALFGLFGLNHWVMSFIDRTSIFLLGLAGLILVLFLEHYYRTAVKRNRLWPRFRRVTGYQLAIIVASFLATWFSS